MDDKLIIEELSKWKSKLLFKIQFNREVDKETLERFPEFKLDKMTRKRVAKLAKNARELRYKRLAILLNKREEKGKNLRKIIAANLGITREETYNIMEENND